MVRTVTVLALMSICLSAQAELRLFKNQDAIQKVLNDSAIMARISSHSSETQSASVSAVSYGNPLNKKFIVRVATRNQTPTGSRVCYNDINVDAEINAVRGSSGELSTVSRLVVKKINPGVCKKASALAARI